MKRVKSLENLSNNDLFLIAKNKYLGIVDYGLKLRGRGVFISTSVDTKAGSSVGIIEIFLKKSSNSPDHLPDVKFNVDFAAIAEGRGAVCGIRYKSDVRGYEYPMLTPAEQVQRLIVIEQYLSELYFSGGVDL